VAIAVAEQKRAGSLDLNVLKSVIVKNFSCNLHARKSKAIFLTIKTKIFDCEPNARYSGCNTNYHNQNANDNQRYFKCHNFFLINQNKFNFL
jgi:hypothetical protein